MSESNQLDSSAPTAGARRPIRSRDSWWARRIADWLISTRISPNTISVLGMIGAVGAGCLLAATSFTTGWVERVCWIAAALLCQFRLLCNLFDGMVAVDSGRASPVGELYNEVPDRVSDVAVFIGLGYAATSAPWLGWAAAVLVVFVPYVRMMAVSTGAPNDFCGPMAKPQRMALVTGLACLMAILPDAYRTLNPNPEITLAQVALVIVILGCVWTALRRLRRAAKWLKEHKS